MSHLINITAPLLGVLLGGFITLKVLSQQFKHQRKLEQEKRLIEKLEQIYNLLAKLASYYESTAMDYINEIRMTEEEKRNSIEYDYSKDRHDKFDYVKLKMLVEFYAPSLICEITKIDMAGGCWAEAEVEAQKGNVTVHELLKAMETMSNSLRQATNSASSKLVSLAKSINEIS